MRNFSDSIYLKVVFVFVFIIIAIVVISKEKKFNCDDYANNFKENFDCHIVLQKIKKDPGIVELIGMDIKSRRTVEKDDDSKWINDNLEKFKIGDTVIKNKGQYSITIKRMNKIIVIPFSCSGKIYSDND